MRKIPAKGKGYTEQMERKKLLKCLFIIYFCTRTTLNRYEEFTDIILAIRVWIIVKPCILMIKLVMFHCFLSVGMLVA